MAQRAKTSVKRTLPHKLRPPREAEVNQRADAYYRELQTLHDVSQAVLASLDIQTILERILDKALLAGSFDVGVIRLLDLSGNTLQPAAHRGYRDPANVHSKTTDPKNNATGMILIQVIAARGSYLIEDVFRSRGMRSFRKEGVRSAMVVPVRAGEEILGVIQLGSRTARSFNPHEIHLFEAIGNQMGLAVQKARFYTQAEQRLRHAEALREIGLSLTTTHDPLKVLNRVAEEARRLTTGLFAFVVTPDKPFYKITAVAGDDKGYRDVLKLSDDPASPYGHGPLGRSIRSRKAVVCEDVLNDSLFKPWRKIASDRGIRSLVAVPLIVHDKPYGAILTYASVPRAYDAETMSFLTSLAAQAAAAVENARLYQESRRQEEIQKLLKELSQDVTSLDPDSVLKKIMEKVREFFKVDICDVRIMEKGLYRLVGASGVEPERIRGMQSNRGRSKWIMENRRAIVIPDLTQETNLPGGETVRRLGIRGYLAIPLLSRGGAVVGVLRALTYQAREFSEAEVDLSQQFANGAAIAIENARFYQELQRKAEIQMLLKELNQDIVSLDIHSLLTKLMARAKEFFKVDICEFRVLEEPSGTRIRVSSNPELDSHGGDPGGGPGRSRWIRENRKPLVISNLAKEDGLATKESGRYAALGFVGVPVFSGKGEVIGVLRALTYQPREFTEEEVDLLQQLANGAAVALEKGQLFQETERQAKEQEALNAIAMATSQSLQVGQLLQTALNKVLEVTGREKGYIRLKDPVTGEINLAAHRGISTEYIETLLHRRTPGGKSDQVFESGEPLVVNDPQGTVLKSETRREEISSIAWIPLKARGNVVGVLNVSTAKPIPFSPKEVALLQATGNIIGVAVENARLFEETKGSLERIRLLREIDTAIASTLDLHALLDLLLEKIDSALPYLTAATIRLLNSDTGELEPAACRNLDVDEWKTSAAGGSRGPGNWVLEKKAPVIVRNVQADPRILDREFFRKYGLLSYVGVPLVAEEKVIGVIGFYTREEREFTGEELEFLSTLAGQAAVAIHKCQLYEAMARSNTVKDEFLSVMSHELRTPLTALMGYTALMQDGVLGQINSEQQQALGKMGSFSQNLLTMIESIIDAAKIESGAIVVEKFAVSPPEFLDELQWAYILSADKGATLNWDYPDELPSLQTDAAKLKQILRHLINNAVKFAPKGRVTVSARLKEGNGQQAQPKAERDSDSTHASRLTPLALFECVEFKVADTGIGIPEESIPLIFEKFRQADSSETRVYGGVGLGLYIAKTFTELLGGKIEVQSELGKGSTFTVTLPCQGERAASAKEKELEA